MHDIQINAEEDDNGWVAQVVVKEEGSESRHTVTVPRDSLPASFPPWATTTGMTAGAWPRIQPISSCPVTSVITTSCQGPFTFS